MNTIKTWWNGFIDRCCYASEHTTCACISRVFCCQKYRTVESNEVVQNRESGTNESGIREPLKPNKVSEVWTGDPNETHKLSSQYVLNAPVESVNVPNNAESKYVSDSEDTLSD